MRTSIAPIWLATALGLAAAPPLPVARPGMKLWEIADPNASLSCQAIGSDGNVIRGLIALPPGYLLTFAEVGPGRVGSTNRSGLYAPGSLLELTAAADNPELFGFAGWSGDVSGPAKPQALTVDRLRRLTANLGPPPGTKKWDFQTGGPVVSSPALGADGTVYVGSHDKKLYALNGATGAKLWEYSTGAIEKRWKTWLLITLSG